MDENPSPASASAPSSHGGGGHDSTYRSGPLRKSRHLDDDDGAAEHVECTGKSCQSCTAGLVADCVAVCCCPCAVVDILCFAFLKIPYVMGRKWLRKGKKKKKKRRRRKCDDQSGRWRKESGDEVGREGASMEELGDGKEGRNSSGRLEGDEVWLELYRNGHLGFGGRLSFTASQLNNNNNNNNNDRLDDAHDVGKIL